jgi:hypothetical protein
LRFRWVGSLGPRFDFRTGFVNDHFGLLLDVGRGCGFPRQRLDDFFDEPFAVGFRVTRVERFIAHAAERLDEFFLFRISHGQPPFANR